MKKILLIVLSIIGCITFAETRKMDIDHPIKRVDVDKKVIALTFDDGPDENCLKYIELFKKEGVKATFFVKGTKVEKYPEIAKALHDAGMEIGNHSFHHERQSTISYDRSLEETVSSQEIIKKTTGVEPKVYRAPCLNYDDKLWTILTKCQLPAIDCSSSTDDWSKKVTAEQIYERAAVNRQPGEIILMHSWRDDTLDMMPKIIKKLRDDGFEFVTVSELLAMSKTPVYKELVVEENSTTD